MAWLPVTVLLNSIAVIILARKFARRESEIQDISRRIKNEAIDRRELEKEIETLRAEQRGLRAEVVESKAHEPIKDEKFIYAGWDRARLSYKEEFSDDFLIYVARTALKVIASELPEEARTQEAIRKIIRTAEDELSKTKIEL